MVMIWPDISVVSSHNGDAVSGKLAVELTRIFSEGH
jgi:hypothetical protein